MNTVLWNNEMSLCVGLRTEMGREMFVRAALSLHARLTGVDLIEGEYQVKKDENIYMMQVL